MDFLSVINGLFSPSIKAEALRTKMDWNSAFLCHGPKFQVEWDVLKNHFCTDFRLPKTVLLTIYQSLILPYLQYCAIIVWANCSSTKLNSIIVLQKRAVRAICKLQRLAHSAPYFQYLTILTVNDIYTLQVSQFMFKCFTNSLPLNFSNYFVFNSSVHSYNTRRCTDFHLFFC